MKNIINEVIKTRRSVYPPMYTGEIVDDKIIHQMLENANWAPSHKRTEPWRFTVFKGDGLKKLAEFQSKLYKKLSRDKFEPNKYKMLKEKPLQCSHVISIGAKISGLVPEIEEVEAVACAVQNMCLTASTYQLGAYWGSGGITYKQESKVFFDLAKNDLLLGFLFIGVPKSQTSLGKRGDINDKVRWIE